MVHDLYADVAAIKSGCGSIIENPAKGDRASDHNPVPALKG
jgi:hypothetical protein